MCSVHITNNLPCTHAMPQSLEMKQISCMHARCSSDCIEPWASALASLHSAHAGVKPMHIAVHVREHMVGSAAQGSHLAIHAAHQVPDSLPPHGWPRMLRRPFTILQATVPLAAQAHEGSCTNSSGICCVRHCGGSARIDIRAAHRLVAAVDRHVHSKLPKGAARGVMVLQLRSQTPVARPCGLASGQCRSAGARPIGPDHPCGKWPKPLHSDTVRHPV